MSQQVTLGLPLKSWLLNGLCAATLAALAAGCASAHKEPAHYTFFPPAPDEPRVQYLTAFSSDLELGRSQSFADYITGRPSGASPLIKPYGLGLYGGKLYVCDTMSSRIQVFDLVKRRSRDFAPRGEGRLQTPINITIDADGTRYVTDTGRDQVLIFGKDDNYVGAIGTSGEMKPTDVAVTPERLYVTDVKGHGVRVYSKADRKLLFKIPREAKPGQGGLYSPTNLAVDRQGHLLVSDLGGFSVQVFDLDGKYLRTIGQQGVAPGLFARPKGIAVDREGHIYVVDAATQVVQVFDADGHLLMYFGAAGSSTEGELYLPAAVKVDYDDVGLFQKKAAPGFKIQYLILVTSQFGAHKVTVYGFGSRK
ncbi:MAG TPA: 6-bladed beta-propeller [Candidatus Acidoferrum sp.]|nr:6-bladed beta-propeller [Candidatus Acidoferrum sp.]